MIKDKKNYKILVVEDNAGDYGIVEALLLEHIVAPLIIRATSFKQAREILSFDDHTFDVIFLDLSLPDKNAESLVQEMMRLVSVCPIIILTGNANVDFSIRSITLGIADYLIKDDLNGTALYKSIIYSIERKKSISVVENSEKRYSDLFHFSPQPQWLFDPLSLRFVQVNKAAIALYGYSEYEFMNMSLMDIKVNQNVHSVKEDISSGHSSDSVIRRTFQHRKKSGELLEMEIYSHPIEIDDRSLMSVLAIDVTEKTLQRQNELKAILKAQDSERYQIGTELHNNLGQLLAAIQIYLGILKNHLPKQGLEPYEICRKNMGLALQEIRNISRRLAPSFFLDSTLEDDFKNLSDIFNAANDLKISLHIDEELSNYKMNREIQLNLYRILQENLANIQKHAGATTIKVEVVMRDHNLYMSIADNGVGFDTNQIQHGIGLANIKKRMELFAGSFDLRSSPGEGCEVFLRVPLLETD